jgi:putative hydrolase of the HAD superfamily
MVRGICFDLFHTLVDVGQVPDEVGRYTADILGIDRRVWNRACFSHHHEIRKPTLHLDIIRTLAHSIDADIPLHLIEEAVDHRQRRFDHALQVVEGDTLQVLSELKGRGLRLALVSNASTAEVSAWSGSPLQKLFDSAIFSCHCGYAKPESSIYIHAAEQLSIEPGQCWFVGDGGSDEHAGAQRAGMYPVLTTRFIRQHMSESELAVRREKVQQEVHDIGELLDLL